MVSALSHRLDSHLVAAACWGASAFVRVEESVYSRPQNVRGLGRSIVEADREATLLERFLALLPESLDSFRTCR